MKMNSICFAALLLAGFFINTSIGQDYVPGEIIIQFQQQPTPQTLLDVEEELATDVQWKTLPHAPHAKGLPNQPHPLSYVRVATVDEDLDIKDLCDSLNTLAGISLACENAIGELANAPTAFTPNDPMLADQYALGATNGGINPEGAWGITTGSTDIVIAIIDSGCNVTHEDLRENYCFQRSSSR